MERIFHWFLLSLFLKCFLLLLNLNKNIIFLWKIAQAKLPIVLDVESLRSCRRHFFSSLHLSASIKFRWIFRSKARYLILHSPNFKWVNCLMWFFFFRFLPACCTQIRKKKYASKVFLFNFIIFSFFSEEGEETFQFSKLIRSRRVREETKDQRNFFSNIFSLTKTAFLCLHLFASKRKKASIIVFFYVKLHHISFCIFTPEHMCANAWNSIPSTNK